MSLEIKDWDTPFEKGSIHITAIKWGIPDFWVENNQTGKRIIAPNVVQLEDSGLYAYILHEDTLSLYEVIYRNVQGFRLLDEGGLLELWEFAKKTKRNLCNTFKVRNYLWSKESPLIFFHGNSDEYSHLISTDNECLEVVCQERPEIKLFQKIKADEI